MKSFKLYVELTYEEIEELLWSKISDLGEVRYNNRAIPMHQTTYREVGDLINRINQLNVMLVAEDDRKNAEAPNG